jgi:cold-inducible RNA-binding protein
METKLYVGNMSPETSEQDLRTLFGEAGSVGSVDIIMDRYSGQPKGFAFVIMGSQAEAEKAVSLFDTKEMKGRTLKVNLARPREERPGNGGYRSGR